MRLSEKAKRSVYQEFKAVLLDKHYQKIKVKMLKELNSFEYNVVFSAYLKKTDFFSQTVKEEQYILLLEKIVQSINSEIDIIFDTFNKNDFESKIISRVNSYDNVKSITACDSRLVPGLQFIDNICSSIRLYKSGLNEDFFDLIKDNVIEV